MHGGTAAPIEAQPGPRVIARGITRLWRARPSLEVAAPGRSMVQRVLAARGLSDAAAAREFLNPTLMQLHEPSLLPDMDRAAQRLLSASHAGEPIVIYGDYDVDGITAAAILWHTLRRIAPSADLRTYVPHRIDEGYGLSVDAIGHLARDGARVIVSVDCGVTAAAAARSARDLGIDLIITDHHNPPARDEDLPPAFAVVHPRRPGSAYPFGELSGAGVAYKLAWRLASMASGGQRASADLRAHLVDMLALAALGTIADVVPLVGENRVLARFGLSRIKHSPIVGLRALVEASALSGDRVDAEDVGFRLGPRLNACGRMGHAREAVELLTTAGPDRSREIAEELCRLNDHRRATENDIFERACAMVEERAMHRPDRRAIVLAHPDWHAGVVGIVCSRLVERYCRPAILLARSDDGWHGSGRSIEGFALADALAACASLLHSHGGHDMAAGLRIRLDDGSAETAAGRVEEFVEAFTRVANERITPEQLVHHLAIDTDAHVDEITVEAADELDRLAPFGQGNPGVRVRLVGATLAEDPTPLGRTGRHAALRLLGRSGRRLRVVAWGWLPNFRDLVRGQHVEAVVTPRVNEWNGSKSAEAELHDLRVVG